MVYMPRFSKQAHLACRGVEIRQLRGRVIVEKIFVMRTAQQIFVGGRRAGMSEAFLYVRTLRDCTFFGRRPPSGRDQPDQQLAIVTHPCHRPHSLALLRRQNAIDSATGASIKNATRRSRGGGSQP